MKILALELSTGRGSIAWSEGEDGVAAEDFANDRKHSGAFFEALKGFRHRFGVPELIVVGLGPGSYAGTRIAIATATGMKAAISARVRGISSLCALPVTAERYSVVGDARRGSFFFATIFRRACLEGPLLCTRDELMQRLDTITHPILASEQIKDIPQTELAYPSARVLAEIAARDVHAETVEPLEPIYLREPYITPPRPDLLLPADR